MQNTTGRLKPVPFQEYLDAAAPLQKDLKIAILLMILCLVVAVLGEPLHRFFDQKYHEQRLKEEQIFQLDAK